MIHLTLQRTILASVGVALALNGLDYARATSAQPAQTSAAVADHPVVPAGIVTLTGDHSLKPAPANPAAPAAASTATTTPASAAIAQKLSSAGLKPEFAALYGAAAQATGTPWQLLAAVHAAETGQSGSTPRRSSAGATGPMQFMPATFVRYATDGNHDGRTDITNIDDAVYSAGWYLAANGATRGAYSSALYQYNHSASYVASVLAVARRLGLS